jgi:TonB family protein
VDLGEDWLLRLHEWWRRHGFYPPRAAELGEDGTTGLRVVVDRSGRVRSVDLEIRSGSEDLDIGSLAMFRDAMLPPFPAAVTANEATLHLTLDFVLLRSQ